MLKRRERPCGGDLKEEAGREVRVGNAVSGGRPGFLRHCLFSQYVSLESSPQKGKSKESDFVKSKLQVVGWEIAYRRLLLCTYCVCTIIVIKCTEDKRQALPSYLLVKTSFKNVVPVHTAVEFCTREQAGA